MAKGLPRSIIKQYGISKKAWEVYRKGKTYKRPRTSLKAKVKNLAKRRWFKKKRHHKSKQIPIALVGGVAGTLLGGKSALQHTTIGHLKAGEWDYALYRMVTNITGYDIGKCQWDWHWINWEPFVAGFLVHKIASMTGINRKLAQKTKYIGL